ncbi:MAG: hypothetical protein IJD92_04925 [Bacilli bacterium]|nr:hypothetical protein [Bacilli bacterium]
MEKFDYSILNSYSVDEYDLILPSNSVVYYYSRRDNIKTLSEFIEKYKSGVLKVLNKASKEEIEGFIDLIDYRYFGKQMSSDYILFDWILVSKDSLNGEYKKGWNEAKVHSKSIFPLKRLGLSSYECLKLICFVEKTGESMLIKDAIELCSRDINLLNSKKKESILFKRKLDLLVKYCNDMNIFDVNSKYDELEKLIIKYNDAINRRKKIEEEIKEIENEINLKRNDIDKCEIKKLLKR